MQSLSYDTLTLKASVLTPLHIWSWESWDRLDWFLDEDNQQIVILFKDWLFDLQKQNPNDFEKLINLLKTPTDDNFAQIEAIKSRFLADKFEKYKVLALLVWQKALQKLKNEGEANNQWIIERFVYNPVSQEIYIPGSSIKWLLRTALLYFVFNRDYQLNLNKLIDDAINRLKARIARNNQRRNKDLDLLIKFQQRRRLKKWEKIRLEQFLQYFVLTKDIKWDPKRDPMSWFWIEDISEISSLKRQIQFISNFWKWSLWAAKEIMAAGKFEVNVKVSFEKFKKVGVADLESVIKEYSNYLIAKEKETISFINIETHKANIDWDFKKMKELLDNRYYPLKLWMHKKEYAYYLLARKRYKSMFLSEQNQPMWWVLLEF